MSRAVRIGGLTATKTIIIVGDDTGFRPGLGRRTPRRRAARFSSLMTVTDQDNGKTIDLAKGRTLAVELASNPSTGYSWEMKGDPAPLKLISSKFEQQDQSGKAGAPGAQQFRFEATAAGASTLKLVYRRPWEKHVAPAKTFTLNVNVNRPILRRHSQLPEQK